MDFVAKPWLVGPEASPALAGKRLLDISVALVLLAVCLPMLVVVALLVRCFSPGPILFRQTRIGRGGRPFCFYKFRTMTDGNDPAPHRSYFRSFVDGTARPVGGTFKLVQDAQVAPIGRFLRYSSLDELPQLINIVRGEMSLVGPRPPIPYETELYWLVGRRCAAVADVGAHAWCGRRGDVLTQRAENAPHHRGREHRADGPHHQSPDEFWGHRFTMPSTG